MPQTEEFVATGRRKTSVARIRMTSGSGKIDINGRTFEDYFPTTPLQNVVLQPLQTAKAVNAYDLWINARDRRVQRSWLLRGRFFKSMRICEAR
jgi:small subunit ribosomal protein S9